MPRRTGKTTLLRKLAIYYIEKGYDVYILYEGSKKEYEDIPYKKINHDINGQEIKFHKFEKDKTVVLIDGIIKWNPHHEIIPIGGIIVCAYTTDKVYRQGEIEYRILE